MVLSPDSRTFQEAVSEVRQGMVSDYGRQFQRSHAISRSRGPGNSRQLLSAWQRSWHAELFEHLMATPRRLRMSQLLQTRDGTPANKDARLTNCILEKNGNELDVLKRPGFALSSTPATGVGAGATVIKDANGQQQIISVVNTTLYTTQST